MKRLIPVLIFLASALSCFGQADIVFDFTYSYGPTAATNRIVWLTPLSTPSVQPAGVGLNDKYITNSGTLGIFKVAQMAVGLWQADVKAPPTATSFRFLVTTNSSGTVNVTNLIVTDPNTTYPVGSVAWSVASSDARYIFTKGLNQPTNLPTAGQVLGSPDGTNLAYVTGGSGSLPTFNSTQFGSAGGTTNIIAGASLTNEWVTFQLFTNGTLTGPNGKISTTGSTTAGIQEAINAALTATAGSTLSNGPCGGAVIQFQSGTYLCSGQVLISNRFPNPLILRGVQAGPSAGTILRYNGTTNFFQTTAPSSFGVTSLLLQNLTVTSEAVTTNRLFKLTDVYQLRGDSCLFCGWGYFTNPSSGSMNGFIGNSPPAQAAGLVAFETGDGSDYTAGVVEFYDCRFWGCIGMATTTDHQFVTDCSFALEGGPNKTFAANLWPVGASYHYPESCYAQSPGWINNSTGGDVLFRGRWSTFNTRVAYIGCKTSSLGFGPTFIVDSDAQLESASYLILQYDDVATQQINVYAPSTTIVRSGCSTIKKPGTITGVLPPNLRFHAHGTEGLGETNLIYFGRGQAANANNTPFFTSVSGGGTGPTAVLDFGDVAGRTILRGTNYLDNLAAGVSIDISQCTVAGGTDSGINGTYKLKGRVLANSFTAFCWTNAAFVILQSDSDLGYGGIYTVADTTFLTELYYNATPTTLGPDYYVAAAGVYAADAGGGTPPTVTFPLVTNASYFRGDVVLDATRKFYGNLANATNLPIAAVTAPGNILTNGESIATTISNQFRVDITHAFVASNATASAVAGFDAVHQLTNIILGTGLTLTAGTLSASGGGGPTFDNTQFGSANSVTSIISGATFTNPAIYFRQATWGTNNNLSSVSTDDVILSGQGNGLTAASGSSSFNVIAGGLSNSIVGTGAGSKTMIFNTISGGTSNLITGDGAAILKFNVIAGGQSNSIVGTGSPVNNNNVIGGGGLNVIGGNTGSATISGGANNNIGSVGGGTVIAGGQSNTTAGTFGTVGGGIYNYDYGFAGVLGGGFGNAITNGNYNVLGGGIANAISNSAFNSTISGGTSNLIGGANGIISATIAGGDNNQAGANYTFAAGRRAKALNAGAFVMSDSQNSDQSSSTTDEMTLRFQNGLRLYGSETVNGSLTVTNYTVTFGTNSNFTTNAGTFTTDGALQLFHYTTDEKLWMEGPLTVNGLVTNLALVTTAGITNGGAYRAGGVMNINGQNIVGIGLLQGSTFLELEPAANVSGAAVMYYDFTGGKNTQTTSAANYVHQFSGGAAPGSGTPTNIFMGLLDTVNFTGPGAGSYEGIRLNVTETSVPTSTNFFLRMGTGGATFAPKVDFDNKGNQTNSGSIYGTTGVGSLSTTAAATIAATGWTNTFLGNAMVYVTATAVSFTVQNRSQATIYTSPTLTTTISVMLQPGWSVNAASGLAGTALPF